MKIASVFVTDRPPALYLDGCIESYGKHVDHSLVSDVHVVDDTEHKMGMAGAVRSAWAWALSTDCTHLLQVEEDFRFLARAPLLEMVWILQANSHLAQVVLKRQAWSGEERQAGGIIESHPDDYQDRSAGPGNEFVEHQRIFSLNPCLIPRRVLELGWPDGNEAAFTMDCLRAGYSFAFFGRRDDPPLVEHVGSLRGVGWRL